MAYNEEYRWVRQEPLVEVQTQTQQATQTTTHAAPTQQTSRKRAAVTPLHNSADTLRPIRVRHEVVDSLDARQRDSLQAIALRAERAQSLPYPRYSTADSQTGKPTYTFGPCYRDASSTEVYGSQSTLAQPRPISPPARPSLTENSAFEGLMLVLMAAYILLLTHNLAEIKLLFKRIARESASTDRLSEESARGGFSRFLTLASSLGMLSLGVLVVKYSDIWLPSSLITQMPSWLILALSLLVVAICLVVAFYQSLLIRMFSAVTLAQPFAAQLLFVRRIYFSIGMVVTTPFLLLFVLCNPDKGDAWFWIILILIALTLFLYIKETFSLFISQKISILHWFLYLCIVEIFPISFLLLIAAR